MSANYSDVYMTTFEKFERDTMDAFDLQPQEGEFAFLPGKGWGTEIAIQYPVYKKDSNGEYVERKKNAPCFKKRGYRSHSDFELYGMKKPSSGLPYTPKFQERFPSEEYFETTKMEGCESITRDELWDNTEITVLANGKQIKTLSIEYLLVEKLIEGIVGNRKNLFDEPDNHGRDISDAAALALVYDDIDQDKVKRIFTRNYINYHIGKVQKEGVLNGIKGPEEYVEKNISRVIGLFKSNITNTNDLSDYAFRFRIPFFKDEDYMQFMAVCHDPKSWVSDGIALTKEAQKAIKKIMTDVVRENFAGYVQKELEGYKKSLGKIDDFFQRVDQRKREIALEHGKGDKDDPDQKKTLRKRVLDILRQKL